MFVILYISDVHVVAHILTPYLRAADVSGFRDPFFRDFDDNTRALRTEMYTTGWKYRSKLIGLEDCSHFALYHVLVGALRAPTCSHSLKI